MAKPLGLSDLLGEFGVPSADESLPPLSPGQGEPGPTEITPPGRPDIYTAGASLDDLLKQADQGKAVGTTQRYFRPGQQPQPAPQPAAPQAPAPLNAPGESEKDTIDRIMGRKKQSMAAPIMLAEGPRGGLRGLADWFKVPPPSPSDPVYSESNPIPDPAVSLLKLLGRKANEYGPPANRAVNDWVERNLNQRSGAK